MINLTEGDIERLLELAHESKNLQLFHDCVDATVRIPSILSAESRARWVAERAAALARCAAAQQRLLRIRAKIENGPAMRLLDLCEPREDMDPAGTGWEDSIARTAVRRPVAPDPAPDFGHADDDLDDGRTPPLHDPTLLGDDEDDADHGASNKTFIGPPIANLGRRPGGGTPPASGSF